MGSLARFLRNALGVTAGLALLAAPGVANEINARSAASGVRIHGPEEVLSDYCHREDDGTLWFALPGGSTWELIPSTDDPAITNPGDGAFHAFDPTEIAAALSQIRYPVQGLDVDIYLLPFPRRGALDSGAGPGLVLLSPGVVPVSREQQHAVFVHELGHVVQYRWLPDSDDRWSEYRRIRGIDDLSQYSSMSMHADRPHEIFAEDFRALYGGALANYSGSIENSALSSPASVPGLDPFLRGLVSGSPLASRLLFANPARTTMTFALASPSTAAIDLFDVTGRRVATLEPAASGAQTVWRWDGHDAGGRTVARGMLLARLRGSDRAALRISWLP